MKINLKTVAGMLCLAACISTAHATLLAYEPFNYSSIANGTAVTGTGESGTWTCGSTPSIVTGLTYSGLPTANSAMQSSGGRQYVGFTSSLSSGTKWISFLFQSGSGNSGGNINGVYFPNGGTGLWFGFGLNAYSGSQGYLGIGSMDTTGTSALGASSLAQSYLGTYGTLYFVAIQIQYGAGTGGHDLVTVYLNPTANAAAPGVSSTYSVGTFSVGTITGIGLNVQGAGNITVDEIRTGQSYGDVSGYVSVSPPATPTGLGATAGVNSVALSWTASTGATSYNVKRSTTSGGTYTTIGTTTAPTTNYTDTVAGGSTYYYEVSAVNGGGESANSSYVSASPTLGAPSAPTGLTATPGDHQVALTWIASAVGSPTSYNVKRSTTSGSGYAAITTSGAQTTTNYTDATAVNGTTYYYVVSAVNATGEGANSTQVSATPAAFVNVYEPFNYSSIANGTAVTGAGESGTWTCGSAPSIVTGLTYTGLPTANSAMQSSGGRQSVTFANSLSSGTKWISFLFKNSAGNPGDFRYGVYFPNGGTGLFFGYVGAYSPTQGNLGVGSMDTTGTSALGASSLANSYLGTYGNTYFVVLKIDFNTSGANDTVTVYINPTANSATPGVTATYTVSSFDVGTIAGIGLNVQASTLTVDEIRTGSSYGDVSGYVSVSPNAPTGLNAAPGANLVSLSWTAATGSPTGYNVKRSTVSGGPYANIGTTTAPIVNYNDSVLGGQTYYYVVSAVNGAGESTNSLQASAAPTLGAPAAPTGLAATADNAQVVLSWTGSSFATSYNVKRSTTSGGTYTTIGTTTAPTVTYTDSSGLNNGTT